jgi:hypothetical protein
MFRTRRDFLTASSGVMALLPALGPAAEGWANMIPAGWTAEDIHAILNQSPWSREVDLELDPKWAPRARARVKSTRRDNRLQTEFRVLVRWESGLPVRLARDPNWLPDNGVGQYQLSISRLPLALIEQSSGSGPARRSQGEGLLTDEMAERIARSTSLQTNNKAPIKATHAEWMKAEFSPRIMISFSPGEHPIRIEDGEIALNSQLGNLVLHAAFSLKDMVYRGRLEL